MSIVVFLVECVNLGKTDLCGFKQLLKLIFQKKNVTENERTRNEKIME